MKLAIVTDAWQPQVNGVVTTLSRTRDALQRAGHEVTVVSPERFPDRPLPDLPRDSARAAAGPQARGDARRARAGRRPRRDRGPARRRRARATASRTDSPSRPRTTRNSRNTSASACRSPRAGRTRTCGTITAARAARWSRRSTSGAISSRTASRTSCCGRAASTRSFSSRRGRDAVVAPRPIWMYAGRVAVEKNLDAFLALDLARHEGRRRRRARIAPSSRGAIPRRCSRATSSASSSRAICPPPTCSCSRAARTRSGS